MYSVIEVNLHAICGNTFFNSFKNKIKRQNFKCENDLKSTTLVLPNELLFKKKILSFW